MRAVTCGAGALPTCRGGAVQAGLGRHGRMDRRGGAAAEVHHHRRRGGRGGGRGLLQGRLGRRRLLRGLLALSRVGRDAVLQQELVQVHVLQLEAVPVVRQGLVPQRRTQEGRLGVAGCAALILQLLLLLLVLPKPCKNQQTVSSLCRR